MLLLNLAFTLQEYVDEQLELKNKVFYIAYKNSLIDEENADCVVQFATITKLNVEQLEQLIEALQIATKPIVFTLAPFLSEILLQLDRFEYTGKELLSQLHILDSPTARGLDKLYKEYFYFDEFKDLLKDIIVGKYE